MQLKKDAVIMALWFLVPIIAILIAIHFQSGLSNKNKTKLINLFDFCGETVKGNPKLYLSDYPGYGLTNIKRYSAEDLNIYKNMEEHQKVPFVACGDFDGNGRTDVAVVLDKGKDMGELVVFLKDESYFKTIKLQGREDNLYNMGVVKYPKRKTIKGWGDPAIPESVGTVSLQTDGLELIKFESWAKLFYWDKGKFKELVTSD